MCPLVSIDGQAIQGILQAAISTNNYYSSDSFSLTFIIGSPPFEDLAWWSQLSSGYVEVSLFQEAPADVSSLITGNIDTITIDPIMCTVCIEGRDLSACLIDSFVQQDFVNQTASEVVSTLCVNFNLQLQVTSTQGTVGRYFEDGYTKLSLGQFSGLRSNWDLVVQLAREQGFDVFMAGTTLTFQADSVLSGTPIEVSPASVTKMRLEQNLAIPSTPVVNVQSWNSQRAAAYSTNGTDTAAAPPPTDPGSTADFLFSGSNLTSAQVNTFSAQYSGEVARLRTQLYFEMPWSLEMSPRIFINLNTGSALDGVYLIDSVERYYSSTSGSHQAVRAISVGNVD